jgi:hypothetical protein
MGRTLVWIFTLAQQQTKHLFGCRTDGDSQEIFSGGEIPPARVFFPAVGRLAFHLPESSRDQDRRGLRCRARSRCAARRIHRAPSTAKSVDSSRRTA